jgi:hypothetical protein
LSAAAMEIHFPTHGDFYLNSNLELYWPSDLQSTVSCHLGSFAVSLTNKLSLSISLAIRGQSCKTMSHSYDRFVYNYTVGVLG